MDPWATLETIDGKAVLRFERRLAHPPEKVFRAISDPAELAHWFPATVETELRAGAPIRFTFEDVDFEAPDGELLEIDRPKLLVYRWGDSVLRWEVVPDGTGCRLHFTHTLGGGEAWGGRLAAARHAAGWDVCLAALEARLDGAEPERPDWLARDEAYLERFGLADGELREHGDGRQVRFERDLVQPVEAVWAMLTEGADHVPGEEPPPRFATAEFAPGAITAAKPGRALEYEWQHDGAAAGHVRWELVEHDFGSGLILTQTLPARLDELAPVALAAWKRHLRSLVATLHGAAH
jgi:uncharacterized protein YndB with AHSA1/START domain